jgi:hypothetical protein
MPKTSKPTAAQARLLLNKALESFTFLNKSETKILATNAQCSKIYAEKVLCGRFVEGENAISTSAAQSFLYARDVLNRSRFELGEKAISESPYYAKEYAIKIIRKRWKLGEPAILTDADCAVEYAIELMNSNWKEAEDIISTDGEAAIDYVYNTRTRFEKAEDVIAKDAGLSLKYARALQQRFEKGEDEIAKCSDASWDYAKSVLRSRFEKGEDAICTEIVYYTDYAQANELRLEKGEKTILSCCVGEKSTEADNRDDLYAGVGYAVDVIKDRWIELENILLDKNANEIICEYAQKMAEINVKMPEEIHNRLLMMGVTEEVDTKEYFSSLEELENSRKLELVNHLTFEQLQEILQKIN